MNVFRYRPNAVSVVILNYGMISVFKSFTYAIRWNELCVVLILRLRSRMC